MGKRKKYDTRLVHSGSNPRDQKGAVNPPVFRASTIIFPTVEAMKEAEQRKFDTTFYGVHGTPTTFALETAMAEVEEGYRAISVSSGLAAITTALISFLKTGDHLLMVDSVYAPTRNFCDTTLKRFGVETTYYDPLIGSGIKDLMQSNTAVVFTESPGSHTFEVQDLPAISDAAHAVGAVVLIDNTWASPLFHKPLTLGADVSIQACTKYIVGHSDALLGSMTAVREHFDTLYTVRQQLGISVGPDDAYLATRGLRTMGVRLRQHEKSTLAVIRWLQQRPEVKRVLYPALEDDPGHALWKRDFSGASGLFGVILADSSEGAVNAMIDGMKLFPLGYSWGGYESLMCASAPKRMRTATEWTEQEPGLRIYVGLEDVDDLIADLEAGFERFNVALHSR